MPANHDPVTYLKSGLPGFNRLFVGSKSLPGEQKLGAGIPEGTSLLLTGPPGAGKTIFGLSLARSIMLELRRSSNSTERKNQPILFYLSLEVDQTRLRRSFEEMGWFTAVYDAKAAEPTDVFGSKEAPCVVFIEAQPETDRPVPNGEEMVNSLFRKLESRVQPMDENPVIVLVDSLTAMVHTVGDFGERRRQTNELLFRLSRLFEDRLKLSILISERNNLPPDDPATSVEEYLADFVFRLDLRHLDLGRRLRTLEVLKSHGANMITGEHTWMILTAQSYTDVLPNMTDLHKTAEDHGRNTAGIVIPGTGDSKNASSWGTVLILPRSRAVSPSCVDSDKFFEGREFKWRSGTPGLDVMLTGGPPTYWMRQSSMSVKELIDAAVKAETLAALQTGSTTLLVGPPGTGKTSICNQFLYGTSEERWSLFITFEQEAFPQKVKLNSSGEEIEISYLSFRHSQLDFNLLLAHVRETILAREGPPERIVIDGLSEWLSAYQSDDRSKMLEAFLAGIQDASREGAEKASSKAVKSEKEGGDQEQKPDDDNNKNEEKKKFPLPTYFISYETSLVTDPLAPDTLGIPADNIIVLRQVQLQDATHRLINIVKGSHAYDRNVREVSIMKVDDVKGVSWPSKAMTYITADLDAFSSLLHGHNARKAQVLLQMFEENDSEKEWNRRMKRRLQETFPLEYHKNDFFRTEIGTTLHSCGHATAVPSADLRIMQVDEWWLRFQLSKLKSGQRVGGDVALLELNDIYGFHADGSGHTWEDFWYTELEKARIDKKIRAVPAYMDFGMFSMNASIMVDCLSPDESSEVQDALKAIRKEEEHYPYRAAGDKRKRYVQTVKGLEKKAVERAKLRTHKLRLLNNLQSMLPTVWLPTSWDFNKAPKDQLYDSAESVMWWSQSLKIGEDGMLGYLYAFDTSTPETCVCQFFELAWAFGASKDFLSKDVQDQSGDLLNSKDLQAAIRALQLLQYLVHHRLMPAGANVQDTAQALYTRQWMSTLVSLKYDYSEEAVILPMSYWPAGERSTTVVQSVLIDMLDRIKDQIKRRTDGIEDQNMAPGNSTELDAMKVALNDLSKKIESTMNRSRKEGNDLSLEEAVGYAVTYKELDYGVLLERYIEEKKNNQQSPDETLTPINDQDYKELRARHELRLRLLTGLIKRKGPAAKEDLTYLSNAELEKIKNLKPDGVRTDGWLTGYGCTGAWFYAVSEKSRSVALVQDIMSEMTSLKAAMDRAELGAGMPVRKDFFEHAGHQPVTYIEHLTWTELYRQAGARCRSRDAVLGGNVNSVKIYSYISKMVVHCLQAAKDDTRYTDRRDAKNLGEKGLSRAQKAIHDLVNTIKAAPAGQG